MELRNLEFSVLPDREVEVRQQCDTPYLLKESNFDFNSSFVAVIRDRYPHAYKNLCKRYLESAKNKSYYEFRITRGFIKCNLGAHDNKFDIDAEGNFHFEFCQCPLAGECKEWKETCDPKENIALSDAEIRVLRLIAQGKKITTIADELYLSPKTIENHQNSMLRKLNVHNNAALVSYWHQHNMK